MTVRERIPGVVYGPAWSPPRPAPRRVPRALRHLPTRDASEVASALHRYAEVRFQEQLSPGMRTLLRAVPPQVAARLIVETKRAAALMATEHVGRLEVMEDDRGRLTLACAWQSGGSW